MAFCKTKINVSSTTSRSTRSFSQLEPMPFCLPVIISIFRTLLACFCVLSLHGCITSDEERLANSRILTLPSDTRVIAIGVRPALPDATIETPFMHYRSDPDVFERLRGAEKQAWEQAKTGAKFGASMAQCGAGGRGCGYVAVLALALGVTGATVGTVTGTVSGALAGDMRLDDTVAALLNAAGIPRALQTRLVGESRKEDVRRFVDAPEDSTNPYLAQMAGIDHLIDLMIARFVFVESDNAGLHTLSISVNVAVKDLGWVRIHEEQYPEWTDIDKQTWNYQSAPHTLPEWQANDAMLLTSELEEFYKTMRQRLLRYLGLA